VFVYVCIYIYIYIYIYTCRPVYVYMYVCICVSKGLYVYGRLHIQNAYACRNTDAVIPSLVKFTLVGVCSEAEHMSWKMKGISKFVNLHILISE
jgi:hypothetical protein